MTAPAGFDGNVKSQGTAHLMLRRPVEIAKTTDGWNKDYKGPMSWTLNKSQWLYVSWAKQNDRGD